MTDPERRNDRNSTPETGESSTEEKRADGGTDGRDGLPTGRRELLAVLAGVGGLGLVGSQAASAQPRRGPPARKWNQDIDAQGNELLDLGALTMRANGTAITDFEGTGLTIDANGVLTVADPRTNVSDDGSTVVADATDIDFDTNLAVTDDGDGSVTVNATDTDTDTRTDVSDDGSTVVTDTTDIDFGTNLAVTDDGDGDVTVDVDPVLWADTDGDDLLEAPDDDGIEVDVVNASRIGTATDTALEVVVGDERFLRVEPTATDEAANIVAGHLSNAVDSGVSGATVAGGGSQGSSNVVNDNYCTIGGGGGNETGLTGSGQFSDGRFATVGGGQNNDAFGYASTVSGGRDGEANKDYSAVGGGRNNEALGRYATVAGGSSNVAGGQDADHATVGGGEDNDAEPPYATVSGGFDNEAGGKHATVGGGRLNSASGAQSTVAGGDDNDASGMGSSVGGGAGNEAGGPGATVAGGAGNAADGTNAAVPGGSDNNAAGRESVAAGANTHAADDGTFVWNDGSAYHDFPDGLEDTPDPADDGFSSAQTVTSSAEPTGADTFHASAQGGVRFVTGPNSVTYIASGSTGWNTTSTRAAKTNVEPVNPEAALAGVESMDVHTWEYRDDDGRGQGVRHIGPMAEAFHDAFDVGETDASINSINADGAAFAAIKGVADRLEAEVERVRDDLADRDDRIDELEAENERLRERLRAIEDRLDEAEAGVGDDVTPA